MDNQRLIIFIALSFVVLLLWEAWQRDYGTEPTPTVTEETRTGGSADTAARAPAADIPDALPETGMAAEAEPTPDPQSQRIRVKTDVLDIEIDTRGGDLVGAALLDYPVDADKPDVPVRLLHERPNDVFMVQSGLRTPDSTEPTHHVTYTSARDEWRLQPGQDELTVELTWTSPEGIEVIKRYRFRRGDYLVEMEQEVRNTTASPWRGRQYRQIQRSEVEGQGQAFIYTYTGGVIYSPEEKYEKYDFGDMRDTPLARDISGGWAAMIQHYFLAAWIPDADESNHYYSKALSNNRFVLGLAAPAVSVAPGENHVFASRLFVGPKLQDRLDDIAPGLELTADYGMLTILAKPIFWLLEKIHSIVGNWGWSIIILTLLIKLLFYKPSEMSYKSMAQMRKLAPRLKTLKERYGDDKQKLNQAMMDLYKTEKINPLGGCLPILIQIPVFIALYWVLLESAELRQADFALWLDDLSSKDPYYILPLIMGGTMFIQQKLNPAPLDPIQAKVMMILPVVFTVFFAFFPSGLVLYWVTNNVLSITQQWVITRRIEQGGK